MIRRRLLMATAIITSVAITACSDTTAPNRLASGGVSSKSSPRSGTLHVEKDCTAYHGRAGDTCTITSSNVKAIKVGTRIVYASDAAFPFLDTDIVLDPPGPGNNTASGHCAITLEPVSIGTRVGTCTLSGGTGKFTHLRASVAVSYLGGPNYAWDGTYSFSDKGDEGDKD